MSELARFKAIMKNRKISIYRALRIESGLNRGQAARELNQSPETLGRIERGEREPLKDEIMLMDQTYGCDGELLDYWLGRLKLSYQALLDKEKAACVGAQTTYGKTYKI